MSSIDLRFKEGVSIRLICVPQLKFLEKLQKDTETKGSEKNWNSSVLLGCVTLDLW